jgi:hypothetical protein
MKNLTDDTHTFSVDEWAAAMSVAAGEIDETGRSMVATHRQASERAEEVCRNWRLQERQAEERVALENLFASAREILEKLNHAVGSDDPVRLAVAAKAIERYLPEVEQAFLTVRHCAQDLLQWADRHGDPEHHELTAAFRALHGRLTSYAPVFKPRLEAFQMNLVAQAAAADADPAVAELLSAITRYNAVLDSARRFVAAVVEPPLDLVFAETDLFLEDVQRIPLDIRGRVGSELNDCCRHLVYEPSVFAEAVRPVEMDQPDGIDSSLAVFESHGIRVLLTVEEDPIFGELTVHLLRAVDEDEYTDACAGVTEALHDEWR